MGKKGHGSDLIGEFAVKPRTDQDRSVLLLEATGEAIIRAAFRLAGREGANPACESVIRPVDRGNRLSNMCDRPQPPIPVRHDDYRMDGFEEMKDVRADTPLRRDDLP